MQDHTLLIAVVAAIVALLVGGWLDIAYLGLAVRMWGFGPSRALPRTSERALLHKRFAKLGPLIGWLSSPWEIFVTNRRLIVNYRNAFCRLDIPLDDVKSVSVYRRHWPMSDDIVIGYSDSGTPKRFLLSDKAKPIVDALTRANVQFRQD